MNFQLSLILVQVITVRIAVAFKMFNLIFVILMVVFVGGEKFIAKVSIHDGILLIDADSESIPKSMVLKSRTAAWFSNERCPMVRVNDDDGRIKTIKELRVGYEDVGILSNRSGITTSMTYAISNFNNDRIYFIE